MKQLIKIRLYLNPPKTYKSLLGEKNVFIERQFDRNGDKIEKYSTNDTKKIAAIKRIINKVRYIYIPALKGEDVLQYLLSLIGEQQLISEENITTLNDDIKNKTKDLQEILEKSGISIGTSFGLPTLLADFWQKLSVKTIYEQFDELDREVKGKINSKLNPNQFNISLQLRGDGIKSKYIPPLLQWLDKNDKNKIFIWGIDEPENSLEFGLADKLARLYFNDYALKNQIFLTSHSLAFINPPNEVKVYPKRIKITKDNLGRVQCHDLDDLFREQNKTELLEDLGILVAQNEFIEEYRKVVSEKEKLSLKIKEYSKPILIVEGKTDKWIIEKAWSSLNPNADIPFDICPSGLYIKEEDSNGNADQVRRTIEFISQMIQDDKIVIGLFDNDREGNNQFKGLSEKIFENYDVKNIERKHKTKKIYGLLLPVPSNRENFVGKKSNQRFLEIEHYFSDGILRKYNLKGDKITPDSELFSINCKNKTNFAKEKIKNLNKNDFENFKILFNEINKIINR
jgi:5S rRNA maturation endonuclease (ribonuclease M5)